MTSRKEGMSWGPIASTYFPNKSSNACRKRHERLIEKKKQEGWDGVKLEELATVYLECHEEMWQLLATRVKEKLDMNEKWQTLENKVRSGCGIQCAFTVSFLHSPRKKCKVT